MLVILERSRILNHRATRESVGTYNYVPDALQIYYLFLFIESELGWNNCKSSQKKCDLTPLFSKIILGNKFYFKR